MLLFPNAKINVGLQLLNKRSDGFHDLETVFMPVQWCDVLEIIPTTLDDIVFTTSGLPIPGNVTDNFIVKAYHAIKENHGIGGVQVHLHKNIPIGGGLGGGSSDVAFFVKGINDLFSLNLTNEEMEQLVLPYGSDCPFFIKNTIQFATGIGTTLTPFELNVQGKWLLMVAPPMHVDTKQAYQRVLPIADQVSLKELTRQPIKQWQHQVVNQFENSVFELFPEVKRVKQSLLDAGAEYASMSGSGATCYGVFNQKPTITFPDNYPCWLGQL